MTDAVRLAKRLAELVRCSRREAELYIAGGWVKVDGQVVEEPQFKVTEQKVELHPDAKPVAVEPATILFNQPPDADLGADALKLLLNANTRAAEDRSGIRLLKQHFFKLQQCLPLEPHAGGLAVFTQDFRVIRKLTGDAAAIEQEYVVQVAGEPLPDALKLLNRGLADHGRPSPAAKVSWQNETHLRFALKGVKSGQIAQMCETAGLQALSMKRLRIGRVSLSGLSPGQWRYLLPYEKF